MLVEAEETTNEKTDDGEQKKVSTHGPRMSGREVWKASKRGEYLS